MSRATDSAPQQLQNAQVCECSAMCSKGIAKVMHWSTCKHVWLLVTGQSLSKSLGNNPGLSRRAIEQEQEYWQRLGNVVDDKLCRVYGAVERNLQSYHQLLKERASGLREVSMPASSCTEARLPCMHMLLLACVCWSEQLCVLEITVVGGARIVSLR